MRRHDTSKQKKKEEKWNFQNINSTQNYLLLQSSGLRSQPWKVPLPALKRRTSESEVASLNQLPEQPSKYPRQTCAMSQKTGPKQLFETSI
jgi:hypothetical protein